MKPNIKHNKLQNFIKLLVEQDESDDYYRISPKEYLELLKLSDNSPGVTRIKKFGGKPLYITGDLSVNGLPITSLGNVAYVDGSLDISRTNISNLGDVKVSRHIWDGGTPREAKRLIAQDNEWLAENAERKEVGEWNVGESDEANKVNAVFDLLESVGDIETLDDNEKEELVELKKRYKRLEKEYESTEDEEEEDELYDKMSEVEDKINELEEQNNDVYNTLIPQGKYYGLDVFYAFSLRSGSNYPEYAVGTEEEMDNALREYFESYVDEVGAESLNRWVIEECIDEDEVASMAEDDYSEGIWDNPDSYFDDDDYELSEEQERRIKELNDYIKNLEEYIERMEVRQNELDDEIEEPDEYSKAYDEVQNLIDEAEDKKSDAESEIENIESSAKEVTQEMVDNKVEEIVYRVRRDPVDYLEELGYSREDILTFADNDCVVQKLIDEGDYGDMNSNNGSYDIHYIDDTAYYIMKIN